MKKLQLFIGYDSREYHAYTVLVKSIRRYNRDIKIRPINIDLCREDGLYTRPTVYRNNKPFDLISNAPMATHFAISRFLVPYLADPKDGEYALFMDCDFLARCDVESILDDIGIGDNAMYCVKHDARHNPGIKMDGCVQTDYERKNWSSFMLWNLSHAGNTRLSLNDINHKRGLDLHQMFWLKDSEITGLPKAWNHLVGVDGANENAKMVHYTLGTPDMKGYERCEYSDEWYKIKNSE